MSTLSFAENVLCVWPQASTFQMAILLQYNHGDNFSVQQLHENTQIDMVGRWSCAEM